jgi:hypothetical protein
MSNIGKVIYFDNLIERAYMSKCDKVSFNTNNGNHVPFQQKNAKCQTAFRTRSAIRNFSTDFANQLLEL